MDTKPTERVNKEGATEIKVETVDLRFPPGGEDQPPMKENVQVIHRSNPPDEHVGKGVVAEAAAKVSDTIQSCKEKVSAGAANTTSTTIKNN